MGFDILIRNWEGGFWVPSLARWPGKLVAGTVCNEIMSHLDWLPTLLAAGEHDIKEKLKAGHQAGDKTFKVHLEGCNFLLYLIGEVDKSPRVELFYFSDDGDLTAMRCDNWKLVFMEQRMSRTSQVWSELFVPLRVPKMFNLRTGPFEDADTTSNTYWDWMTDRAFLMVPAPGHRGGIFSHVPGVSTRQKAASFTVDQVMEKLLEGIGST